MFLHSPELAGRTPKQDCPSQSPATNNSFNNSYFENEEDLHREIAKDLGVSYADKKFQYSITWEMGVEFNAPQRRVVGKGVGFKIWRLARLG